VLIYYYFGADPPLTDEEKDKNKDNVAEPPKDPRPAKSLTSTARNFVTQGRAIKEYLLKPDELIGLRKTMRRSPHADEPPILVYWRRDVEARCAFIITLCHLIYLKAHLNVLF